MYRRFFISNSYKSKSSTSFVFKRLFFLFVVTVGAFSSTDVGAQLFKKKQKKKEKAITALAPWMVDSLLQPIPIDRQLFADKINQQIKNLDLKDGDVDRKIEVEDSVTTRLGGAVIDQAYKALIHVENIPNVPSQTKIKYLKHLEQILRTINNYVITVENMVKARKLIYNYEGMVVAITQQEAMKFVQQHADIYSIDNSTLLDNNPEAKAYLFEAVGKEQPELLIKRLPEFARERYADPIIAAAAPLVPGTILSYATSTSNLSAAVRRNKDPLVQSIVRIATESHKPLKALPFLNAIHQKKLTIKQVDVITSNPKNYYKALVELKIEEGKANKAIDDELELRALEYVREVNRLHDAAAPIRFKSVKDFNAEALYFLLLQDEIYTSSYTYLFDNMLEKMKPLSGDAFLSKVKYQHFRTFIRTAAGYNKLSQFFATMQEADKNTLMTDFVSRLEQGAAEDLTDAVDVADAYGSITDKTLITFLQSEINKNYERVYKNNNKESEKGVLVYGLLSTIFKSAENTQQLSGQLGEVIPPITYVTDASLKDSKGQVIVQSYFYGDDDGKASYESFKSNFSNKQWKSSNNGKWVTYTSNGKNPIVVYANLPLTEPKDEAAQKELQTYLDKNNIEPTIVIHRGHSYHLEGSLAHLTPKTKIVMLGSCGGFHNLAQVLDKSPDAHIISSKQVGSKSVNEPIIKQIINPLLEGKDVDWVQSWAQLQQYFSNRGAQERDLFSDYVPPHRNLGAIFIKAYRKMSLEN
jgi:hypothetical protein